MHKLVKLIGEAVIPKPKPAVYISGSLDSTIVLHHLNEKTEETIFTYTAGFPDEENEFADARQVADHYETKHRELVLYNILETFPKILQHFDRPRYNLWCWWLARAASQDGRKTAYCGEGSDEHFGGYWYKKHLNYNESWIDHLWFARPTYQRVHELWNLNIEMPFSTLPFRKTLPYWDSNREKQFLREAYKGIIPDCAVEKRKRRGGTNYKKFWNRELSKHFPNHTLHNPYSDDEVRKLWNLWVTKEWLKTHENMPRF